MLKRILNLIRQDWTNALRDNIMLYMILGPLLMAVGARLLLPSVDQAQVTFAVQGDVDAALVERLDRIGAIALYRDADAVRERVLRADDVPGLLLDGGEPVLVFEGNEGDEALALRGIVEQALRGEPVAAYTHVATGEGRSFFGDYAVIILIMFGMMIGALVMAFSIVEDKETRAAQALSVSPLSMLELTLARGLFALTLSLAIVLVTTFVLAGARANYPLLLVGFALSSGLPILTGYVIGGLSDNQLKAIAILKFYMVIYLTLPIVTVFLSRSLHPFFYILPNYWMWHTFENLFVGNLSGPGFWLSGLITLGSSLVLVAALLPVLRRQLALR